MSTSTQDFNADIIGVPGDAEVHEVTKEKVVAYAAATNDDIPQHASGEIAPPVYAVVAAFESLAPRMAEVIPPELLMMGVHGEQDFRFHKPITPGMVLTTRTKPFSIAPRSSGVTVTVLGETRDQDGDLVVEQYMMSFVRGAQTEVSAGDPPPDHAFPEELRAAAPLATVEQRFDADQTFRYSEASGDLMPIHLDDDLAKAMGLPGIIIHGLCTMAFTSRAVIQSTCPEDPTRLKRLAVRFSKPCLPEQTITTAIYETGPGAYAFETTNDAGQVVIKDGLAEVA